MSNMRGQRRNSWLLLLLALALGLALRLYFYFAWPQIDGDGLVYGDIAKNLLQHGVYGRTISTPHGLEIHPTLIRLPGYPLFLAGCFLLFGMEHYHAVLFVQIAVDLSTCLLIARFVDLVCRRRAAWVALFLGTLCPFTANFTAASLTETLTLFCVALAMLGLVRIVTQPGPLAVGLCAFSWSGAALLRPDGALLAIAFLPAIVLYGRLPVLGFPAIGLPRALKLACVCGLLSLVPFTVWTYRNWHTFHLIQPLAPRYATDPGEFTEPGFNRWVKTWAVEFTSTFEIYWNANANALDFASLPDRAFDSPRQRQATLQLFDRYNETDTLTPELDAEFGKLADQRVGAHPLRYYLWLPFLRVTDMWLRPRVENLNIELRWWQFDKHESETIFAAAYAALNLFYVVAALVGLVVLGRTGGVRFIGAMAAYLLLRDLLLATIEAPEARYTIEGFPFLIAWAAMALGRCPPSVGFLTAKALSDER